MAHRNVHFFQKGPTIIYNQTNNYNIHHCHGGLGGGFMGGSLWSNPLMLMQVIYSAKDMIGSMLNPGGDYASFNRYTNPWVLNTSTNPNKTTTDNSNQSTLKNLETIYKDVTWVFQDGEFWGAKNGEIVARGKTFDEANAAMQKYLGNDPNANPDKKVDGNDPGANPDKKVNGNDPGANPDKKVDGNDPGANPDKKVDGNDPGANPDKKVDGNDPGANPDKKVNGNAPNPNIDPITGKPKYDIEANTTNRETVKTIPYGGPWHYAHYYTDANGKQLSITSNEFSQIVQSLKTEMGEVEGDRRQRTLPKEIEINGTTYTLMNETEREKLGLRGKSGGADTRYKVVQSSTTYSVYETDAEGTRTLLESGLTKEQADKLKADKEAALEK